jgi:inorganic pyrophosphatase
LSCGLLGAYRSDIFLRFLIFGVLPQMLVMDGSPVDILVVGTKPMFNGSLVSFFAM